MKKMIKMEIRISKDGAGHNRFTEEEVKKLIDSDELIIRNMLVLRKSDGKVVGEISFNE